MVMTTNGSSPGNMSNTVPRVPMGPPPAGRMTLRPMVRPFPPMACRSAGSSPPVQCPPIPHMQPVPSEPLPMQNMPEAPGRDVVPQFALQIEGRRTASRYRKVHPVKRYRLHAVPATSLCIAAGSVLSVMSLLILAAVVVSRPAFYGLHLKPIRDVVCTSGDRVIKQFEVEYAEQWRERIEYRVHIDGRADATINRKTGQFVWYTDRPGRYKVTVTAKTKSGHHSDRKSFTVLVKRI